MGWKHRATFTAMTEPTQIQVLDVQIDVVKKDIKNLHLAVYPPTGRVRIAAPQTLSDEAIRLFAITKLRWIKKHQKNFYEQLRELPREYISGESHYFDGRRYLLNVIERYGKHEIKIRNRKYLDLYVQPGTTREGKARVFNEFYRQHLKTVIPEILEKWEQKTKLKVQKWTVKKMQTQWGSCNIEKRHILLNLELAKKPRHCLEYVLVHEMTHFLVRHHNEQFQAHLDRFYPNWRAVKRELNMLPLHLV